MMTMVEEAITNGNKKLKAEIEAKMVTFKKDICMKAKTHAERITKNMHKGYAVQMLELKKKLEETIAIVDSICSVITQEEESLNAVS